MPCEFCAKIVDTFKLETDEDISYINAGRLDNVMALNCQTCRSLREKIRASCLWRIEDMRKEWEEEWADDSSYSEYGEYNQTLFDLIITKHPGRTSLQFVIDDTGGDRPKGNFGLDGYPQGGIMIELVRSMETPW
jgi:hypothetical protein